MLCSCSCGPARIQITHFVSSLWCFHAYSCVLQHSSYGGKMEIYLNVQSIASRTSDFMNISCSWGNTMESEWRDCNGRFVSILENYELVVGAIDEDVSKGGGCSSIRVNYSGGICLVIYILFYSVFNSRIQVDREGRN